jgi:argininosuccinate lyase
LEQERELHEMSLADLQAISEAFAEDFFAKVTLEAVLDCHDVTGGTARGRVAQALGEMERRLKQLQGAESADVHA